MFLLSLCRSVSPNLSGGKTQEVHLLVRIDQIIIGFRWENLVWLLWQFMNGETVGLVEERRQDLLWLVNDPVRPTIITDWPGLPVFPLMISAWELIVATSHSRLAQTWLDWTGPHKLSQVAALSALAGRDIISQNKNLFTVRNRDKSDQFVLREDGDE